MSTDRFSRLAFACVVLFACLFLAGCTRLESLDDKSNNLLDELNGQGSSSSGSSSTKSSSGLSVVKRDAMPVQTVKDTRGNKVQIWGQPRSTSTTPGHDDTIVAVAIEMASSGKYDYVTMQRSWRTATGRVASSRRIPDIIGVRHDGKVDAFEVKSKSDDENALMQRLKEGMDTLPSGRRGRYEVLKTNR